MDVQSFNWHHHWMRFRKGLTLFGLCARYEVNENRVDMWELMDQGYA